jgi:hypothetical protein
MEHMYWNSWYSGWDGFCGLVSGFSLFPVWEIGAIAIAHIRNMTDNRLSMRWIFLTIDTRVVRYSEKNIQK